MAITFPLDFSLLTPSHFWFFLFGFIIVYAAVGLCIHRPGLLRGVPNRPRTYFAGIIFIGCLLFIDYFILPAGGLRVGLIAVGLLTIIIGIIDENKNLPAGTQLIWQIVIALIAVSWGWTIQYISHPFGAGILHLDQLAWGNFVFPGSILTVIWLIFIMNAINWLDGLDGQAPGVGFVTLLTLAAISLLPSIQDPTTISLALAGAGCLLAFLLWNFYPARVYLGTQGSWFLGLYIGLVAIIGNGKIVTTLLVLSLPVIDLIYVVILRLVHRQAPWRGDTSRHWHHRLLARGFSPRVIALAAIIFTALLGLAAVLLQTTEKIFTLFLAAAMLILITGNYAKVSILPFSKKKDS
ncbi:MAG: MraY family glycosyltransferase [Candidatus Andersenbacteria bacterium]|nr:MraY family glycosyltransferase [bacterium]MDZ4225456.1 MraY family glycosyltransferase [Candidatus Andersenbacteria bacterium]